MPMPAAEIERLIREAIPDAKVVLLGQYARLMPNHAAEACAADFVVSQPPDLAEEPEAPRPAAPKATAWP